MTFPSDQNNHTPSESRGLEDKVATQNSPQSKSIKTVFHMALLVGGIQGLFIACENPLGQNGASDSETNALDQYVGSSQTYSCSGEHLPKQSRYTDGRSFGGLKVAVNPQYAVTLKKSLGAVPVEIGKTLELLGAQIQVTDLAKDICKNAQSFENLSQDNVEKKSCWIAENKSLKLVFDENHEVLQGSVLRTLTYAFSEYVVPNINKITKDQNILNFANAWTNGQSALVQAFLADVKTNQMLSLDEIKALEKHPHLAQDVTAETFDSYFCNLNSQQMMKKSFPNTWKVFTGSKE